MTPRETLMAIMKDTGLTAEETAAALHVSAWTVKAWLKPETSASSNKVPPMALELLEIKTGRRPVTLLQPKNAQPDA